MKIKCEVKTKTIKLRSEVGVRILISFTGFNALLITVDSHDFVYHAELSVDVAGLLVLVAHLLLPISKL